MFTAQTMEISFRIFLNLSFIVIMFFSRMKVNQEKTDPNFEWNLTPELLKQNSLLLTLLVCLLGENKRIQ
jgi:hypothetical protein